MTTNPEETQSTNPRCADELTAAEIAARVAYEREKFGAALSYRDQCEEYGTVCWTHGRAKGECGNRCTYHADENEIRRRIAPQPVKEESPQTCAYVYPGKSGPLGREGQVCGWPAFDVIHEIETDYLHAFTPVAQPSAQQARPEEREPGCSGVDWCDLHQIDHYHPEPPAEPSAEREEEPTPNLTLDAAELLWNVVANASGGDWTQQSDEWRGAAERARDKYHAALRESRPVEPSKVECRVYINDVLSWRHCHVCDGRRHREDCTTPRTSGDCRCPVEPSLRDEWRENAERERLHREATEPSGKQFGIPDEFACANEECPIGCPPEHAYDPRVAILTGGVPIKCGTFAEPSTDAPQQERAICRNCCQPYETHRVKFMTNDDGVPHESAHRWCRVSAQWYEPAALRIPVAPSNEPTCCRCGGTKARHCDKFHDYANGEECQHPNAIGHHVFADHPSPIPAAPSERDDELAYTAAWDAHCRACPYVVIRRGGVTLHDERCGIEVFRSALAYARSIPSATSTAHEGTPDSPRDEISNDPTDALTQLPRKARS